MAKPQFSETQFVMGFLGEYFDQYRSKYPLKKPPFLLPTTTLEPVFAADFILGGLSSIDFFQFKRSELMQARRGDMEIRSGLPKSFRPYYRFKIYNDGHIPQFDRLRAIAALDKRFKVYYCAPKFHSYTEFHNLFWNQEIINNSAIINCSQFNHSKFKLPNFDINDGDQHFIVFNKISSIGYVCSEIKSFDLTEDILEHSVKNISDVSTADDAESLINLLYDFTSEMEINNTISNRNDNRSLTSKLFYTAAILMQRYGILTQLKYD